MNEEPLLINPVITNPADDLEIDRIGVLHKKTARGETTIAVFGLNLRQSLVDERRRTYESVKDKLKLLIVACAMQNDVAPYFSEIEKYKNGSRPYSIAGRKALIDFKVENQNLINFLNH